MAKKAEKRIFEPEVLPPAEESAEVALVKADADVVTTWLNGLATFFREVRNLEQGSTALEVKAKGTPRPTTKEQDAAIVQQIQVARSHVTRVGQRWVDIKRALDHLHKAACAAEKRGEGGAKRAIEILQPMHTAWDRAQEQIRQEQIAAERARAEAEAKRKREEELAALETARLEAEAASPALSDRERVVVDTVVSAIGPEGCPGPSDWLRGAENAGYKDPKKVAGQLAGSEKLQAALLAGQQALAATLQARAVAARPLDVVDVVVHKNVEKVGTDKVFRKGRITNERKVVDAIISGKFGIPLDYTVAGQDVLGITVKQAWANDMARQFGKQINLWPGMEYYEDARTY